MNATYDPALLGDLLDRVRSTTPLVHNITNYVTAHDVANILLACGGSPIMADEPDEAAEITAICGGLNINIGTLHRRSIEAMFAAGRRAAELGHPILLDPVGAGASRLRTETALRLLDALPVAVVRGNVSEVLALASGRGTTRGVDAAAADAVTEENLDRGVAFAKGFAADFETIVAITGAIDLVADAGRCYVVRNGRPRMGGLTGTGCQLSGMMAAFVAAGGGRRLEAALAAVCAMGLAGEIAEAQMRPGDGNATYGGRIIDAISNLDAATLSKGAKYEVR